MRRATSTLSRCHAAGAARRRNLERTRPSAALLWVAVMRQTRYEVSRRAEEAMRKRRRWGRGRECVCHSVW